MTGKEKEVGLALRDGSGQRDGSMAFTDSTEGSFAGALCLKWTPGGQAPAGTGLSRGNAGLKSRGGERGRLVGGS